MIKKTSILTLAVLVSIITSGCTGTNASSQGAIQSAYNELYGNVEGERLNIVSIIDKLSHPQAGPSDARIKKAVYTIDSKYKKDKLIFKSLDYKALGGQKLAVVGKRGVKLYRTMEARETIADLPLGAVLPLLREIKNKGYRDEDGYCDGIFDFKDEKNYWYETSFEGKKGFVFGSFLVLGEDYDVFESSYTQTAVVNDELCVKHKDNETEKYVKLGYYYTKPQKAPSFVNFNGRMNLAKNSQASLIKNRIALEKVAYSEYEPFLMLGYESNRPDDMLALYSMMHNDRTATSFISTDLLVHSLHLLFDRMLQDTETRRLLPILKTLTKAYYGRIADLENNDAKKHRAYTEAIEKMKKYFLVAGELLNLKLAPRSSYPADVSAEIALINAAAGFNTSPIFGYREDYSQFKARGHYTKNDDLKSYFKGMVWFGRLHFYCVSKHPDRAMLENSIRLTRSALLLTKIARDNPDILASWRALSLPIGYMVGESDDYTLDQYLSIFRGVDFANFEKWVDDKKNIQTFIIRANAELKPPAISGNTLMQSGVLSANSPEAPAGFRFLGQRFTLDSFIHNALSSPRLGGRNMVKGLDVMGALGSRPADRLLGEEKKRYPGYEAAYRELGRTVNGYSELDWKRTFYNSYLKIIGEISRFDSSLPFYFTDGDAWNTKSLLTAHAAWAELRHDTILYVKQSYGEKAGPGPCKTFSVEKPKRPIGYIEPNLGALYWIRYISRSGAGYLADLGLMTEEYATKFREFSELIDDAVVIAELEAADKRVSDSQNEFIYSIPYRLSNIVVPIDGNVADTEELKMALIADVYTDSENGLVLEVGTGIPYRMHIALNDGQGGKRIATGYIFSYYEFTRPMSDRLNNEEWKRMVYSKKPETDRLGPGWAKKILP